MSLEGWLDRLRVGEAYTSIDTELGGLVDETPVGEGDDDEIPELVDLEEWENETQDGVSYILIELVG